MKPLKTEFVIADRARARWVRRSETADDFVTVRELSAPDPQKRHPEGVAFEGHTGQRFSIEPRGAAERQHRLEFARDVADMINKDADAGRVSRLAVVAPARMLGAIRGHLGAAARAALAHTLVKDLMKTPDHRLGDWLRLLERG